MLKRINPLVIAGLAFILTGLMQTALSPLATVSFGELEVSGISAFSALSVFIGLVLIIVGMKRRHVTY